METNERICWRILIFCKYCKLFSLRFRYCLWFLLRHQCLFGWRTVVALIIIYNTKRNTENAWEHKMHETIYTFVMVIFIAAAVATAIPSLHGSNTHKRCYIWKYELQIHLNACSKSYYSFFFASALSSWQRKVPHSHIEFSTFFIALEGTSSLSWLHGIPWCSLIPSIHSCHQYFDMQSDIFCISSSRRFSISYGDQTKKYYYDQIAREKHTHARYFSRTYFFL